MGEEIKETADGAYVEYLATELGAMLLPEDFEALMAMARRAEAAARLRAALEGAHELAVGHLLPDCTDAERRAALASIAAGALVALAEGVL
jgi:hypothetical protein